MYKVEDHLIEKGKDFHKKRNMKAVIKDMVGLLSSKPQRGCARENQINRANREMHRCLAKQAVVVFSAVKIYCPKLIWHGEILRNRFGI